MSCNLKGDFFFRVALLNQSNPFQQFVEFPSLTIIHLISLVTHSSGNKISSQLTGYTANKKINSYVDIGIVFFLLSITMFGRSQMSIIIIIIITITKFYMKESRLLQNSFMMSSSLVE